MDKEEIFEKLKSAVWSAGLKEILRPYEKERFETSDGYSITYRCPICNYGEILYEKDETPGFKSSDFFSCTNCGYNIEAEYRKARNKE